MSKVTDSQLNASAPDKVNGDGMILKTEPDLVVLNELTQEMAEKFIAALPDGPMPNVIYQRVFVEAAFTSGWVTGPMPTLRADMVKVFAKIKAIWEEANTLPKA